jgi:hypothetical protein
MGTLPRDAHGMLVGTVIKAAIRAFPNTAGTLGTLGTLKSLLVLVAAGKASPSVDD